MYDLVSGYRIMEPGSVYNCVRRKDHNNCGQQMLFVCLFDVVRCAFVCFFCYRQLWLLSKYL